MNKNCTKEHFQNILKEVENQVFHGKGDERHGHGSSFENQPWKHITDNVGIGFVVGQALKKLMELRTFEPHHSDLKEERERRYKAWKREALGAVVYIVMAIMYKDMIEDGDEVSTFKELH